MWLFSLFLLALASPKAISGSDCFVETLKCSRLRPTFHTHKKLLVSLKQINEMCRQQTSFFQCLDHMVASRLTGKADLPPALQHARTLIKDLCSNSSPWQKKYLELALCINKQKTEFCTSPDFLGSIRLGDKPRNKCSIREEAVSCIAAILSMNCGLDAGKLFHHLLRMTSDGDKNCYSVGSDVLFIPTIQHTRSEKKLETYNDDLYSNLVKRIGNIPEQDDESIRDSPRLTDAGDVISDPVDATTADSLESTTEEKFSNVLTKQDLENIVFPQERYGEFYEHVRAFNLKYDAVRFHSNSSLSVYSRHTGFNMIETISCDREQGKRVYLSCYYSLRTSDPVCYEGERGRPDDHSPIIPEDIDPELGARLYAMFPISYYFRDFAQLYKWVQGIIRDSTATDNPVDVSTTENIHDLYTSLRDEYRKTTAASDLASSETESTVLNNEDGEEIRSSRETLAYDGVQGYVMGATTLSPPRYTETTEDVTETTGLSIEVDETIFGEKQIPKKLYDLLEDVDWFIAKQRVINESDIQYIFKPFGNIHIHVRENSQLVKIICGRVNECHPNATYISKCAYYFAPEGEQSTEGTESPTPPGNSWDSSTGTEVNADTDRLQPQIEKRSGSLENREPVVVSEVWREPSSKILRNVKFPRAILSPYSLAEELSDTPKDLPSESVQIVLLEPDASTAASLLDSEESLNLVDANTDNEDGIEYIDLTRGDEHPLYDASDIDVDESFHPNLILLKSWNDLENTIASLENVQEE